MTADVWLYVRLVRLADGWRGARPTARVAIVVALAGAAMALAALIFTAVHDSYERPELWADTRVVNGWVAYGVATLVGFRLTRMVLDVRRWLDPRARHLTLWFVYIAFGLLNVAVGSQFLSAAGAAAGAPTGLRFLLNIMAISLSVWWPHPRDFTPLEETTS